MNKLQINVGKCESNESDLKASTRKYRNLRLHSVSQNTQSYLRANSWVKANILLGSIRSDRFSDLLGIFARDIREIELYVENIKNHEEEAAIKPITFENLESLTFRWTTKKVFSFFGVDKASCLRNVVIELQTSGNHGPVKKFLCQNKHVSSLSIRLHHDDFDQLFSDDFLAAHELKLKVLSLYWNNSNVDPCSVENLITFLKSQTDCVERIVFEATFDCKKVIELMVNGMKTLKHLTFVDLSDEALLTSQEHFNLQPNLSLKQIDVCVNWFIRDDMFKQLITASPNLEILYIYELSVNTLKFLAENTRNLRHLIYEEIDDDCEEIYNEMIESSHGTSSRLNLSIKIHWEQEFEIDYPKLHRAMQFL